MLNLGWAYRGGMKLHRALSLVLPAALLCGTAGTAVAESKVGMSFGLHTGSPDDASAADTLVAPRLDLQLGLSKGFAVRATIPMTSLTRGAGADGDFRLGNPYFGAVWGFDLRLVSLEIGVGLTLPVAGIPDGAEGVAAAEAFSAARGINGLADFWLYTPDSMALVVPMRAELDILIFEVHADLTLATVVSTGDDSTRQSAVQVGVEALFNIPFIGFGARIQSVWVPTANGDKQQLSIAPLVEVELGPIYARSMLLVNLDGPSGFSFSDGTNKFWGWHVGGGVKF